MKFVCCRQGRGSDDSTQINVERPSLLPSSQQNTSGTDTETTPKALPQIIQKGDLTTPKSRPGIGKKRPKEQPSDKVAKAIVTLAEARTTALNSTKENAAMPMDEDEMFFKSLIPTLKQLPDIEKMEVKIYGSQQYRNDPNDHFAYSYQQNYTVL